MSLLTCGAKTSTNCHTTNIPLVISQNEAAEQPATVPMMIDYSRVIAKPVLICATPVTRKRCCALYMHLEESCNRATHHNCGTWFSVPTEIDSPKKLVVSGSSAAMTPDCALYLFFAIFLLQSSSQTKTKISPWRRKEKIAFGGHPFLSTPTPHTLPLMVANS